MIQYLKDPRDLALLRQFIVCSAIIPPAIAMFVLRNPAWYIAIGYAVVWFLLAERFTMAYHCVIHRPLFKPCHKLLKFTLDWMLGPFFGQTPETFLLHHRMHHAEDNQHDDLSSTMAYRRDTAMGFIQYYARFSFLLLYELPRYFLGRVNSRLARRYLYGAMVEFATVAMLLCFFPIPTLLVFVMPHFVARFFMIMGNWVEHAFIDSDSPDNAYRHSLNVRCSFNERCFNAGFHIYHHLNAGAHFSELAAEFEKNIERYGREDAVVFDGIDLFGVWLLLMSGRHQRLVRYFVRLPGAPERTDEEIVAMLRRRMQPISRAPVNTAFGSELPRGAAPA